MPVEVDQAKNRVGMQWADIAGRAMLKATTPGSSPPHRIEPAYLEALAPVIWRRRRLEAYGIKSVESGWHLTQPVLDDLNYQRRDFNAMRAYSEVGAHAPWPPQPASGGLSRTLSSPSTSPMTNPRPRSPRAMAA